MVTSRRIEYLGKKRFVRLDAIYSGDPSSRPPLGAIAILTKNKPKTLKVLPAIYPDDSAATLARYDAMCAEAGRVATSTWRGGASLEIARKIASLYLHEDVAERDIARLLSHARANIRQRSAPKKKLAASNDKRKNDADERVLNDFYAWRTKHAESLRLARVTTLEDQVERFLKVSDKARSRNEDGTTRANKRYRARLRGLLKKGQIKN